jgi:hypothetical protein
LQARIGHGVEPVLQLHIQVIEIAEGAGEEEVLADIAERSLHLALGLGPIGPAGFRLVAIVPGKVDERPIVDDAADGLADHRRLHTVVEDLMGHAADRRKCRHVAAQDRLHVLVQHEARPDQPAEAEHEGEQPNDARHRRLVREHDLEVGKIDLRLRARRGLEANLEGRQAGRPNLAQQVGHGRVAALVAELPQLAPQPAAGQGRIGRYPLTQIRHERLNQARPRLPRPIDGRLQAAGNAAAHGLAVEAQVAGNGRNRKPLPMKVDNHHDFPKFDHRSLPHIRAERD